MFFIRYYTIIRKLCPYCKESALHEHGNLLQAEDEISHRERIYGVNRCINCGKLLKDNNEEVDVVYKEV